MRDFEDLVSDVKEIKVDVKELVLHTTRNTTNLELHMARTDANERRIEKVENWLVGLLTSILLTVLYYLLKR